MWAVSGGYLPHLLQVFFLDECLEVLKRKAFVFIYADLVHDGSCNRLTHPAVLGASVLAKLAAHDGNP